MGVISSMQGPGLQSYSAQVPEMNTFFPPNSLKFLKRLIVVETHLRFSRDVQNFPCSAYHHVSQVLSKLNFYEAFHY